MSALPPSEPPSPPGWSPPPPPPQPGWPPPQPGWPPQQYPGAAWVSGPRPSAATRLGLVDASFGARLGASLIDSLVQLMFTVPIVAVIVIWLVSTYETRVGTCTDEFGDRYSCDIPTDAWFGQLALGVIGGLLVLLVAQVLYYALTEGRTGQTWGKRATNIRTVDILSAQPIGTGRAIGRYFGRIISGQVFWLGYLWMLWDDDKQTWHDKMVRSIVVNDPHRR